MGGGSGLPEQADLVVCVVSPKKDAYSETFIQAHIERLPAQVIVLWGGSYQGALPQYSDDGRPLFAPAGLVQRIVRSMKRRLLRVPRDHLQKAAIEQFLLRNEVEAVLAEYGPTGIAMMEMCERARIPLIVHFHGYDAYERAALEGIGRRYPELFQRAEAIVAVSRHMEKQLLRLEAPREKLHYNPYGVDTSVFRKAEPSQAPPTFVAVGRFVDKKAPELTLLAFAKVHEHVPEARLLMIGDGPLWETCSRLSRVMGLDTSVDLLGPRSHSEVAQLMRGARAFVQHSLRSWNGDSEGTPLAVLEAGATGLPVVATRHAGIPDVVVQNETGFLVDEEDVASMGEAMLQLAQDPVCAGRLGRAAQRRIRSMFSIEKSISGLGCIIETAIQAHQKHLNGRRRPTQRRF